MVKGIYPQNLDNLEDCLSTFKGINLIQDISRILKSAEEAGVEVNRYLDMIPRWTQLVLSYPSWGFHTADEPAIMLLDVLREQINSWIAMPRGAIMASLDEYRNDILSVVTELHDAVQADETLSSGFRAYMFAVLRRVKEAAKAEFESGNFDFADAVFEMSVMSILYWCILEIKNLKLSMRRLKIFSNLRLYETGFISLLTHFLQRDSYLCSRSYWLLPQMNNLLFS